MFQLSRLHLDDLLKNKPEKSFLQTYSAAIFLFGLSIESANFLIVNTCIGFLPSI